MWRFILALAFLVFGVTGAQAAADDVSGYNGISVTFSKDVALCGVRDASAYEGHLGERLFDVGLPLGAGFAPHARLAISAEPFPETGGKCVILVTFAFYVTVEQDSIEVVEAVINREAIVAVFDRIEYLPVVLYEAGEFTVSDPHAGHATALTLIGDLTSGFAARR